jgi:L-amino acid N-acyltransferase YncA
MHVRAATAADLPAIVEIFNRAIETSVAIFELSPYRLEERAAWFTQFGDDHPLLVHDEGDGDVDGFAYYLPFRAKAAYARTKEITVYTRERARRRGVASRLYEALIGLARTNGVHVLVAVLGGKNPASEALHQKHGFALVGQLHEVGFKLGSWIDTYYYEKLL